MLLDKRISLYSCKQWRLVVSIVVWAWMMRFTGFTNTQSLSSWKYLSKPSQVRLVTADHIAHNSLTSSLLYPFGCRFLSPPPNTHTHTPRVQVNKQTVSPSFIAGLPDHVRPSPGDSQPDQLFLRQQHDAGREPRDVRSRRLRLPARGRSHCNKEYSNYDAMAGFRQRTTYQIYSTTDKM